MYNRYVYRTPKGLNRSIVEGISQRNNEPGWMTDIRLKALSFFEQSSMPEWGADLSGLDEQDIHYYVQPIKKQQSSWEDIPQDIKQTFVSLGIPAAEQKFLAGVGAQYESEMIYKRLKKEWANQGVIFTDTNKAIQEFPELIKKYFATVVPYSDNRFAALNTAVWSGGSFVYVPRGVTITMPLQAYFRINSESMGQFERTLIVAEPESFVHYVEGCSAPVYRKNSLHSAVVELVALNRAHIRYTTIQNWSGDVYNLVTKRAIAHEDATVEWVDGNFGSKVTMKYPCIILKGARSKGQVLSIAVADKGQQQDAGAKIIHAAPDTTSTVISKSICQNGGRSSYRGLLRVLPSAHNAVSHVQCDALMLDDISRSDTYPRLNIDCSSATIGHEASVSKVSEQQLFYLMSRGISESAARAMIVNGFIDVFVKELPMEYAIEINRLIAHKMEGSIG